MSDAAKWADSIHGYQCGDCGVAFMRWPGEDGARLASRRMQEHRRAKGHGSPALLLGKDGNPLPLPPKHDREVHVVIDLRPALARLQATNARLFHWRQVQRRKNPEGYDFGLFVGGMILGAIAAGWGAWLGERKR